MLLYAPSLDGLTAGWRTRGDADAPPHLVLAHPFLPVEQVDVGVHEELRWFFAGVDGFAVRFGRVERREGVLWLVPEEQQEVTDLAAALALRWPEPAQTAPPVPRLAVARGDDAHLDEVERALQPHLPVTAELTAAGLWSTTDAGWSEVASLPLAEGED